jgi:hypothetical protein
MAAIPVPGHNGRLSEARPMSWLTILGIAVLLVGVASVLGLKPRGGRPAERTRLMTMARIVLLLIGLLLLYLGFRG